MIIKVLCIFKILQQLFLSIATHTQHQRSFKKESARRSFQKGIWSFKGLQVVSIWK